MSEPAPSPWRRALADAVPQDASEFSQLGLLFELRTLVKPGSQWVAPQAQTASSVRAGAQQRLAVRPALRSKKTWTTSTLGWKDLQYKVERLRIQPAQLDWFRQFQALHRATAEGYTGAESDWLHLDTFASPLLWPLLEAASDQDLALVSSRKGREVQLAGTAESVLEVSGAGGGGLQLAPTAMIDGERIAVTGTIADHGIYAAEFTDGLQVTLAQASAETVQSLRWDREELRIPAAETAEFWQSYAPHLARTHRFTGLGIELPAVKPAPAPGEDVETEATPMIRLVPVPGERNDWFDLRYVLVVGAYTVALADVFRALSTGRPKLRMVDGTYLSLRQPIFDVLRDLIADGALLKEWEVGNLVPPHQAHLLEPFEDTSDQSPAAVAWRRAARALVDPPPPIEAPSALQAALRPYQLDGFRWLAHLRRHGLGGILADDMGLGKTVQTIAMLLDAVERRAASEASGDVHSDSGIHAPALVVAPTSVVGTWSDELARFAPSLRVAVIASGGDAAALERDDVDVFVTSYTLLRLRKRRFASREFSTVVIDEAQAVKNPAAQVHESVRALRTRALFALTGTPLENGLTDLWAILRLAAPGLFPSRIRFADRYVKTHSAERIEQLRTRIRPLLLRRTKDQVAPELPPRQEQLVQVDLTPDHRALYDRYLQRERQKVLDLLAEDEKNSKFIVFRSLTLLRRLALDPRLIDAGDQGFAGHSAKLDELVERIVELAAEGHRALVFSQFTSYLALVRTRLEEAGIDYAYLDGSTADRPGAISGFRAGEAPVFLISLRAGGVGLTLTEADYVFLLDPWWNPAAENQAIDRAHRIGQDRPVMVYRMIARDTIEEKVLALARSKQALFDEVVDDGALFQGALTADDIRELLA